MSELTQEIRTQRSAAEDYLRDKRKVWDQAEQLFHNQLNDQLSETTKSNVFDPKLATLTIERSYRVMSQLMVGKVRGMSSNDIGDAMLKNLLLEKYVIPNANAQFDFLTKMRMVDMYSNIYGNFFTLMDWDVKPNGYVGPDVWLINIRDVFPQVGAVSLEDSDYIIIRTWKPMSYFESLGKRDGYKNVDKLNSILKEKTGSKSNRDTSTSTSKREDNIYAQSEPAKKKGYFEILTRFERDRWVDYCVDADLEFRDQKNPQDDNDLPVKCKYSIPLLDDFMGFSDFERGGSLQKTVNSVWNLYLDGVAMSIFPPILVNKDNIASMSSLKYSKAAKWLVRNQINNAAQAMNLSPQGIAEFNNVYRTATASLLNLFGTTDTTVQASTDPGFGKTPQALQMQQQRENTRDNADRFFMEQYLTQVMRKFCNLLSKKQSSDITLRLFPDEIENIARSYPEVKDGYDKKKGTLQVKKGKSELYDYEIVSGSTYTADQKLEQQNLALLMQMYQSAQSPDGRNLLVESLKEQGYEFKFGELFKRLISKGGIQDWDKILIEMTEEEKADAVLQKDSEQFQQALNQMQGVGQTPPMPEDIQGQMTNGISGQ
jgi:hypothetical protein